MENPLARPLVLLASSRADGHTGDLTRAAFPDLQDEIVDLAGLRIGYFDYDYRNAGDDFIGLVERSIERPLWVLATPLYWYTMSAQAKTFIDRLSDLLEFRKDLGHRLRGKSLAVICSGADDALPANFEEPIALTADYLGIRYIGCHYHRRLDGESLSPAASAAARDFGLRIRTAAP
jgi:putative NADPH-quinone reductase